MEDFQNIRTKTLDVLELCPIDVQQAHVLWWLQDREYMHEFGNLDNANMSTTVKHILAAGKEEYIPKTVLPQLEVWKEYGVETFFPAWDK